MVEQRMYAVLRIAFSRCNQHCWHLLSTTRTTWRRNPRKTTNKTAVKWCYSTITPVRTLLTCQKHYTGVGLGSHSAPTLFTWSCALRFSLFPLSIEHPSRNLLSLWKCAPNMACRLQLKTKRFLQARNRKFTPACQLTIPYAPTPGRMMSENGRGRNGKSGEMKSVAGQTGGLLETPAPDSDSSTTNSNWSYWVANSGPQWWKPSVLMIQPWRVSIYVSNTWN